MIVRTWHGWTAADDADVYEHLLVERILPGIADKGVEGYLGAELCRRTLPSGEVEFLTILRFDSLDAVRRFAGEDHERAYVPDEAREVLIRFDERSQHYDRRHESLG